MSYIKFDKEQLVNLEYSLQRELIRSNRGGSYASTTITGCNTRKYHGLLVSQQPKIDNQHHVFLSSFDATVIQKDAEFNLGIHKYAGDVYDPGGHKYMREFESDPIPKVTYRVGGVILTMERVFAENDDRILIRYTLVDAHSPTKLKFKPFMAFRSVHILSKANDNVDTSFKHIKNGIRVKMYEPYSPVFIQFSKKANYVHNPNWYYGIEYSKEKSRGYDYKEDLYVPGFFEVPIKKGENIVIAAGLKDTESISLKSIFNKEIKKRTPRDSYENCLINAASQFFIHKNKRHDLIAGYHWFDISGRDTFISLPHLTLPQGYNDLFLEVTDTMVAQMKNGFFPSNRIGGENIYNSVDASLWFFWALQQYFLFTGDWETIWKKYRNVMSRILKELSQSSIFDVSMQENGLLRMGNENEALTWMNVKIEGKPFLNRSGLAVEVNALWYNAIRFYIETAKQAGNISGVNKWKAIPEKIEHAFIEEFWDDQKGYLADVVRGDYKDFSVRPNQVIATALPFKVLTDEMNNRILKTVKKELLTPRGLRTLSPKNKDYLGIYKGDIIARDTAYHQGSAFPWLLGFFADGYLHIHGKGGLGIIERLYAGFENEMIEAGIGTISELYYGDPPHKGKGAISQAWSVAALLRINHLIKSYK